MPISDDSCHGPCNNTTRRLVAEYDRAIIAHADAVDAWVDAGKKGHPPAEPIPPEVEPRRGEPRFCSGCKARILAALLDLDNLASELQALSDGHRGTLLEGRVSGSRSSGSPSSTADLLDKLYGFLTDVEDEWRDTWGYARRTDRIHRGAHPRTRRITWLSDRLEGILGSEDHVKFGLDVLRWEVVLRDRLKEDSVGLKSPIRCPRRGCGERRVVRKKDGYWECGACSNVLSDPVERQQRHEQGVELVTRQEAYAS